MLSRLRPWTLPLVRYHLSQPSLLYRRFADKHHRNNFRKLETEYSKFHTSDVWTLRPTVDHFLFWLRRKAEGLLSLTKIGEPSGKLPLENFAYADTGMFHVLVALHSSGERDWLKTQSSSLERLRSLPKRQKRENKLFTAKECMEYSHSLGFNVQGSSLPVLMQALCSLSLAVQLRPDLDEFTPWIQSLTAPNVTRACKALANLSYIPAFVVADVLVRTPLTAQELRLQLDLWLRQMGSIAVAYLNRTAYVREIIQNLLFYAVHYDMALLAPLVHGTLSFLTSTKEGYNFKVMTNSYVNTLIYDMANYSIRHGFNSGDGADDTSDRNYQDVLTSNTGIFGEEHSRNIIRAQRYLANYLVKRNSLAQRGYLGIVLAIAREDPKKAQRLFQVSHKRFPEITSEYYYTSIHLSATPESLFHTFNTAIAQYPNSALLWYIFVRKLMSFDLLTEERSHKLLLEILNRKNNLLISKDLILLLLAPLDTVSGVELFIAALEKANMFKLFEISILRKYTAILFKHGSEVSIRKPFLDRQYRNSSNIACARYLYAKDTWKTMSCVGVMLNGEVDYQPENLYELYKRELTALSRTQENQLFSRQSNKDGDINEVKNNNGNEGDEFDTFCSPESDLPVCPSEGCLKALLRGSMKEGGKIMWGKLYALQVAVHEFQKFVCSDPQRSHEPCLFPSNKLWRVYLYALINAGYIRQLADVLRWWEHINFIPDPETLLLLILAFPEDVAQRHIKHAAAIPRGSKWPWPTLEEVMQFRMEHKMT